MPINPVRMIATWGGAGLVGKAPGTVGTLCTVPLWWGLAWGENYLLYGLVTLTVCGAGWWAAARYSRETGVGDPREVVVDEAAGFLITMAGAPLSLPHLLAGFLLFRLFDIAKPWPVGYLDRRVHGGLGIMADDVAAGAMAWLLMNFVQAYWERMMGLLP